VREGGRGVWGGVPGLEAVDTGVGVVDEVARARGGVLLMKS